MIKELRIGNLIGWHSTDGIDIVEDIRTKGLKHPIVNNVDVKDVRLILLTGDWAIKSGFKLTKKTEQRNYYNYNDKIDFVIDKELGFTYLVIKGVNIPCKFVHQFQNIIYDLSGEELKINLKENTNQ